jgi:hypothetical protein
MSRPSADDVCGGCFLHERTGGVCPAARDPDYDPAAVARRVERIRQAITDEAQHVVSLRELMRGDAERQEASVDLATAERLALPRPAATSNPQDRKEKVYVRIARKT